VGLALDQTQADGLRYFGDPVVFVERLVTGGRHVEVQIIADDHGTVWASGVRDCSIQRRNHTLIEESSSPVLTAEPAAELRTAATTLVREVGYLPSPRRIPARAGGRSLVPNTPRNLRHPRRAGTPCRRPKSAPSSIAIAAGGPVR
jgi:hypothetical protein